MVGEAKRLEDAGAALLNFTNSGPVVGAAVAEAVSIPVLGGFGGGPWLDGRMRMATAAIGYSADRRWTTRRTPTPTSRRSRTTRSPRTPTTCGRRARSRAASTERMSVSTAVVDGIVTRYEVAGSGPPLLMFSPGGFNATLDNWDTHGLYQRTGMLAQLRERFTCITFDKRESGRVGRPGGTGALADYVHQGVGLLDHLGYRAGPHHGRLRRLLDRSAVRRRLTATGWRAWCCTRRPAAPKYRLQAACAVRGAPGVRRRTGAGRRGRAGRRHRGAASPTTAGWGRG